MLRSLLIEFRRRAGSYISPSIIILMSLLVCFFLFNLSRPVVIQCVESKFELNGERCLMARGQLLMSFRDLDNRDIVLKELIEEIEDVKGVESVTYSISELIEMQVSYRMDSDYEGFHTLRVASNFLDFFDIELLEGSGFSEDNSKGEVIITETVAKSLESGVVSAGEQINLKFIGDSVHRSLAAVIKGDFNTYNNLIDPPIRDTPTLFESIDLEDEQLLNRGTLNLLFKIEESSNHLEIAALIDDILKSSSYRDLIYSRGTLPLDRHRENMRSDLLSDFKIVIIPFGIFIIYILISLLGSMISIMGGRIHDIGVRRALGYTKLQVMLFIIFEPLSIFVVSSILAISIIWSIKDITGISELEEIIIYSEGAIFIVVLLSLIYPLIELLNRNHIDVIKSE